MLTNEPISYISFIQFNCFLNTTFSLKSFTFEVPFKHYCRQFIGRIKVRSKLSQRHLISISLHQFIPQCLARNSVPNLFLCPL